MESFEAIPALFKLDSTFQQMINLSEIANMTAEEFEQYHVSERQYRELKGVADAAREEMRPLLDQALAEKEEALAEKEKTHLNQIRACQHLHKMGLSESQILEVFKISKDTLEEWLRVKFEE